MTNELIKRLSDKLNEVIIFDRLEFVESKKIELSDSKSLYLIFRAYNSKIDQFQKVVYSVDKDFADVNLHPLTF